MDFGNFACSPCTSALPPLGTFLENVPLSVPLNIPFMSNLVFLAKISLAGYLLLFSLWFFTVDSAYRTSREDVFLLIRTLIGVLRKTFLLIYNRLERDDSFSIDNSSNERTTYAYPSIDINNNNKYKFDSPTCNASCVSSGSLLPSVTAYNNNNYNCLCTVYNAFAVALSAALHRTSFSKYVTTTSNSFSIDDSYT